ncbi:MAG: rRNA maturation RNase YbeY [Bacteroidales bacterium]|nr:rRNA maturation RNase YbeY [Bacteroidales bacterium]MDD7725054.1 rRNA maturation RNase YbeY [Bacteroidales bacterium]MDY4174968.1 rRNA maturation RNase YbeY [Bacteroidales bacterium]
MSFFNEDVDFKLKNKLVLKQWIKQVAQSYGMKVGDLTYIFCSDDKIIEVNRQFLQHDYYTDIITFDYDVEGVVSGDMYISVDTVRSNSEIYAPSFERELQRVIIHGVLHLCGLKDKQPDDEKNMRSAEEKALAMLDHILEEKKTKA